MAYIKIHFVRHSQNILEYIQREKGPNDPTSANGFQVKDAQKAFKEGADLHGQKGAVQAIHIIQSWNEAESKTHDAEMFQSIGRKLVSDYFPGHDFLITTHTNTGKTHNHIVVNPWHSETGKKIENKKYHLYKLRDLSDGICRSHGLSVIDQKAKDRAAHMPDQVRQMIKFNGRSYLLDIMQKADLARGYATNFDDFVSLLDSLGVQAVVQNKNITYFYPGKKKGKRGSKLGKLYDKEGLSKAFEQNRERQNANPKLRYLIQQEIATVQRDPSALSRALANLNAPSKEYAKLRGTGASGSSKTASSFPPGVSRSERDLRAALIPIQEIHKAKAQSIVEYAKRNKISLTQNPDGSHTLTGRPFVQIHGTKWINTRNRTQGSLIDFVAAHKNVTFLEAVAEINANPRLLLFQKEMGKQERMFTSFYIPQDKRLSKPQALEEANTLFRSLGIGTSHVPTLIGANQLQVAPYGMIRLFSKSDYSNGLEFTPQNNTWTTKRLGSEPAPFYSSNTGRRQAVIYSDPFTFLGHQGTDRPKDAGDFDFLALFEPNKKAVDLFLAANPSVKELHIVPPLGKSGSETHELFVRHIKSKCTEFGISVNEIPREGLFPSRDLDGPSL